MRNGIFTLAIWLISLPAVAQDASKPFRAYLYNEEYEVYLQIDFYDESISVPGNELYGQLPGYLGKKNNSFCWPITAAKLKNKHTAELNLINDYGSEDLSATLTCENDSTYTLKQGKGSALKVPKNGKWQKLPGTLSLKRRQQ